MPSAAEKPLSGGRTKTREQRSPIRELSKVQLRRPGSGGTVEGGLPLEASQGGQGMRKAPRREAASE